MSVVSGLVWISECGEWISKCGVWSSECSEWIQ